MFVNKQTACKGNFQNNKQICYMWIIKVNNMNEINIIGRKMKWEIVNLFVHFF